MQPALNPRGNQEKRLDLSIPYCLQGFKLKPLLVNEKSLEIQFLFGGGVAGILYSYFTQSMAFWFRKTIAVRLWPAVLLNLLGKAVVSDRFLSTEGNRVQRSSWNDKRHVGSLRSFNRCMNSTQGN